MGKAVYNVVLVFLSFISICLEEIFSTSPRDFEERRGVRIIF